MITIDGYVRVTLRKFVDEMKEYRETANRTDVQIAYRIKKSTDTVKNSFKIKGEKQIVSDTILTDIANYLGIDCFVLTHAGIKYYYIKK